MQTAVKLAVIADRHIPIARQFRVQELAAIAKMQQEPLKEPMEEIAK